MYSRHPAAELPSDYCAIDLETTGLDTRKCHIVEIGAVKVRSGYIVETFSTFIGGHSIPADASAVNGITNKMLKGAPTLEEVLPKLDVFLGDDTLIGHNANSFDRLILEREAAHHTGFSVSENWVDTLELFHQLHPGQPAKLSDLCTRYGVNNTGAHRALSDATATSAAKGITPGR